MGQKPDEITRHIELTREKLGWNLEELEYKVKSVTDWRQQFRKNPLSLLGVAFSGGILLAATLGGNRRSRSH
jgi:hypothetical protein